jgi:hypothetical protein
MTPYEKGFEDCKKQVKAAMVPAIEEAILMEREACAKECLVQMSLIPAQAWTVNPYEQCSKAIRARWQK